MMSVVSRPCLRFMAGVLFLLTFSGCQRPSAVSSDAPIAAPPVVVERLAKKLPPPDWTLTPEAAEKAVKAKPASQKAQFELGLAYYKVER